jgi:hypothetical protein
MPKSNLPTYAIVELLIRLAKFDSLIGDYKDHAVYDDEVIVKTSGGNIRFPALLVAQQFQSPELITDEQLKKVAQWFNAAN